MDYIALNHQNFNPGVHYNNGKIGGIKYYSPKEKNVIVNNNSGTTKVIVEIKDLKEEAKSLEEKLFSNLDEDANKINNDSKIENQTIALSNIPEFNLEARFKQNEKTNETLEAINKNNNNELLKRLDELVEALNQNSSVINKAQINTAYKINIQGKEVNFSNYGIKKSSLTIDEKRWLAKAQNYFITAKEDGIRIGSAEDFTTMEILEALWSTAEHVGTDPKRFIVQVYNESRFNPNARGQAGERGIGQFMENTAKSYGYDWTAMNDGIEGFAYQALASADFVKKVGEIAYNGSGEQAEKYQKKINHRLDRIADAETDCVLSNIAKCSS
jgi:Transglycosylase SLT domain